MGKRPKCLNELCTQFFRSFHLEKIGRGAFTKHNLSVQAIEDNTNLEAFRTNSKTTKHIINDVQIGDIY